MKNYKEFFWELLPRFYDEHDTYKDAEGKGLLRRFLTVLGEELQQEFILPLEDFPNHLSPETASNEFLSEIAYQVGKPLDILENIEAYRTLLTMIISIYKIKGTTESYRSFFGILGYEIELEEHFPADNLYDSGVIYDDDDPVMLYDTTNCEITCTDYTITYKPITGVTSGPLTEEELERVITSIVLYLQPVNANLKEIIYEPS